MRCIRTTAVLSTSTVLLLATIGQIVRDRTPALGIMMYLPCVPIGLAAVVIDLALWGRSWKKIRFGLATAGVMLTVGGVDVMLGRPAVESSPSTSEDQLTILHWNVIWGGARSWNVGGWDAIRKEILSRDPDLVILSEAPANDRLDQLVGGFFPRATIVCSQNPPGESYMYKMVLIAKSKYDVKIIDYPPLRNGRSMQVEVRRGDRRSRLLVVDGQSNPFQSRSPFLDDISAIVAKQSITRNPVDLIAGDFNCVRRSAGFDPLIGEQFKLASERGGVGWRGTFPSPLPLYDIDHILVRSGWADVVNWQGFTNLASDHRGQVVRVKLR